MEGTGKRPKFSYQRLRGQQRRCQYSTCEKLHDGIFHSRGLGCYKCGRVGHVNRDCPQGASLLCFHRNRVGHKKHDGPMLRGGEISAPALATLRITNGREGRT